MTTLPPPVFVTGASGFIGEEVALGFRRAGHRVYGLVRSPEKAAWLAFNEITPVVGDLLKPASYIEVNYTAVDNAAVMIILTTLSNVSTEHDPALVIFTSGIIVYKGMKSASDPPIEEDTAELDEDGLGFLAARIHNERTVLHAEQSTAGKVIGVVVRPAYVYGRKSRHFYDYFDQAANNNEVVGDPSIVWSEVHIDDLVAGYLLIASAPNEDIASQAFHFADSSCNTNLEIAQAFAQAAGFQAQIRATSTSLGELAAVGQKIVVCSGKKAEEVLGWKPKKPEMLEEVDVMWERWRAAKRVEVIVQKR
ncbi:hypothetical protein BC937DRAFT_90603 [Endogone sp. FLAS-F59071]|nr:hypothetical protein BC937DRAFT_90603 [Endogone sp. FLAS-F59071]|eukprot:RUS16959.1 hypothetical protein BC937DRAFT_90603 [Endogone sp. FLAS-F59071]